MISFTVALCLLVAGYFLYGKLVERVFAPDNRTTPATSLNDGVDYVPMKPWRIFMIQFLNIAGLGPIFGAIMGAKFGLASYFWIVFGCIFGGAVHDYFSGMLSMRNEGCNLPELHGKFLGEPFRQFSRLFTALLLLLTAAVFVSGPAGLLSEMTPDYMTTIFWIVVIFIYYMVATMLPVDKVIGRFYPLFAVALLFMAAGVLVMLYVRHPQLPEVFDGVPNTHPKGLAVFPMMFISIACGAISGFHATQSPLMARCITNEHQGRWIFYGAMVTEGVVALVWAAAAIYFFREYGYEESNAAVVVKAITSDWLGSIGGILAILGVVAAPITSGDTALRSARLIIADMLHVGQTRIGKRLLISVPLFLLTLGFLVYSLHDKDGFNIIWRYFACANQSLAVLTLWALSVYLLRHKGWWHLMTLIPAVFMTAVCGTYILYAPEGFSLPYQPSVVAGVSVALVVTGLFYWIMRKKIITHI
ncbi:MAG: carbon starvation protein A [Paludibacteraceae bacterium]|nr:carbon starvation protein A [Paludibacteraceae bacterium]